MDLFYTGCVRLSLHVWSSQSRGVASLSDVASIDLQGRNAQRIRFEIALIDVGEFARSADFPTTLQIFPRDAKWRSFTQDATPPVTTKNSFPQKMQKFLPCVPARTSRSTITVSRVKIGHGISSSEAPNICRRLRSLHSQDFHEN